MFIGISNVISGIRTAGLSYIKDNLKLYLDFKSNRSNTLKFPCEGSTYFITDDYIVVPDNDAFDFNESDVSITAWIKPTDLSTNYTILDKRVADQKGIMLEINGGQNAPFFQISDGTNDYYAYFDDDLVAGVWNHIAISFKVAGTGDATFYLNGVDAGKNFENTANVGDTSNTAEIRIGKASDGYTAYPFKGSIANLAVWSRALSAEEINSVMRKNYSQLGSVEKTSLVSWWALDTDFNDSKGSNNGTNNGATINNTVFGNNAPVLPRAVDVAREGEAEKIGNGSALFNGTTDLIQVSADSNINNLFEAGGSFTAWIKPDNAGESSAGRVSEKGFVVYTTTTSGSTCKLNLNIPFSTTAGNWITTNHNITFDEWQHIAITYDGSSASNEAVMYINGISVAVTNDTSPSGTISADTATLYIGNNSATTRTFDGEMSQVGLWRGVLTQAQIQSVMESTSYDKIPADVKSTLGSEKLPSGDFKSNTSLTITQGSSGTLEHDTTAGTITATGDVQDGKIYWSGIIEDGKLYKATFVVDSCEGGRFRAIWGWTGNNFYPEVTSEQRTYVDYFVGGSSYAQFAIQFDAGDPCNFVLSNVSVKEVTNDIVAYFPLDADNSANGVTNDATTGEVLGSELISNGSFDTDTTGWIKNNGSMDVVNGELKVITSSSYWEGVRYNFGAVVDGGIYKAVFTARLESGNSPQIQFSGASGSSTYSNATSISGSSNVTYTFYFIANANNSNTYLTFFNGSADSSTFYLDNVSLKKVTSNTGVLK